MKNHLSHLFHCSGKYHPTLFTSIGKSVWCYFMQVISTTSIFLLFIGTIFLSGLVWFLFKWRIISLAFRQKNNSLQVKFSSSPAEDLCFLRTSTDSALVLQATLLSSWFIVEFMEITWVWHIKSKPWKTLLFNTDSKHTNASVSKHKIMGVFRSPLQMPSLLYGGTRD